MRGGWLPVNRGLLGPESPVPPGGPNRGSASSKEAWIDLGALARFEPGDGLARGEFQHSQGFLATRWGWTNAQVRRFLERLEDRGWIERRSGSGRTSSVTYIVVYEEHFATRKAGQEPHGYGASTASASGGTRPTNPTTRRHEEKKGPRTRKTHVGVGFKRSRNDRKRERVAELEQALVSGCPRTLLHCVSTSVAGITTADCVALMDLLGRAAEEYVSTEEMEAPALFAEALYDLGRKRVGRFTMKAFIAFVRAAMRRREIRPGDSDDAQSAWSYVCSQAGWGGEQDTQGGGMI